MIGRYILLNKDAATMELQDMNRRSFLSGLAVVLVAGGARLGNAGNATTEKVYFSEEEWRKRLTPKQFRVLREEGTERAYTSPLNDEKRKGTYACTGCGLALFTSDKKYDSGTGWPSFYDVIPGRVGTKTDYKLILPRTEYHCSRCGGHQGHVFKDGPPPTGLRYCNNGVALTFIPAGDEASG